MKKNQSLSFKYWFLSVFCKNRSSIGESGFIILIAMGVILGLAGLVALYAKTSSIDQLTATAALDSNSGFYGAEAALNTRADLLRQIYINHTQPSGTSPIKPQHCFDPNSSLHGSGDFQCLQYTYAAGNTNKSTFSATTYIVEQKGGQPTTGVVPNGDTFQGLSMQEYGHSIYALSFKDSNTGTTQGRQASAILQMDVKNRVIPLFQFAAFYTEDLEILPGRDMILNGPVHTDKDLYLGAFETLVIKGQITAAEDLFNKRKNDGSTYVDGKVQVDDVLGNPLNLLSNATGSTSPTTNAMDPTQMLTVWGTRILVNTNAPITVPQPSVLNNTGEYYDKADIRIKFTPQATSSGSNTYLNTIPFEVTSIDRLTGVTTVFNVDQLRSLRQPVMVGGDLASIATTSAYHICRPASPGVAALPPSSPAGISGGLQTWWNSLTTIQKNLFRTVAQRYVREQIQSQNAPLLLTHLNQTVNSISTIDPLYNTFANNIASLDTDAQMLSAFPLLADRTTAITNLDAMTPQQVAGLEIYSGPGTGTVVPNTAHCFIAAPIMEIGMDANTHQSPHVFYNEREQRYLRILQMNIQSMAVWNRDGFYLNSGTLTSVNGNANLFNRATADASAPADSFQRLGLAADDTSEAGIVIHGTIDGNTYTSAAGTQSPYAFAVVQGHQLFGLATTTNNTDPTGITIASDQAVYAQGDYNNVNKQPAAILSDSFNLLSNACLNNDKAINHDTGMGCDINGSKVNASDTVFNGALLAGTNITTANVSSSYNGGLENYPRFLERWTGKTLRYRGSFVSISTPLHVDGPWILGPPFYRPPDRDWDYDVSFNNVINLPPLTPRFVALKQESFIRSFEQ